MEKYALVTRSGGLIGSGSVSYLCGNSISILEAVEKISKVANKTPVIKVKEKTRIGDHQWYISDNSKSQKDFPSWEITYSLENLIEEMVFTAQKTITK